MKPSLAVKWLAKTIRSERRALERARCRFIAKPSEKNLHGVRTTGRRFRSLLEDVSELAPLGRLIRRVKRAAAATDAARDATIILRLLENSIHAGEAEMAHPLLERLREQERLATRQARKELRRMHFAP
ncbi:MAG: CHAD domain-containing protein [Candidatus Cybelea sp.]